MFAQSFDRRGKGAERGQHAAAHRCRDRRFGWYRHAVALLAIPAFLTLTACGGRVEAPSPTAPASPAVPSPDAASPPANLPDAPDAGQAADAAGTPAAWPAGGVGAVVWTRSVDPRSKAPLDPVDAFPPDAAQIIAAVPVGALAPGTTVTADWSYNKTPLEGFSRTIEAGGRAGRSWIEFHLVRRTDDPWPSGTYAIEIRLDGGVAQTAEVRVGDG